MLLQRKKEITKIINQHLLMIRGARFMAATSIHTQKRVAGLWRQAF